MAEIKAKKPGSVSRLTAAAFQKYAPELRRYVLRRLRQPEDAPDLTQDIFERFLKVDQRQAIHNPQAYLFRIASHVVNESLCRDEHSRVTYDSELVQQLAEVLDDGARDALADTLALQRDIKEALRSLPDNHLAALMLVKGEGLSYEEAAREAGFTENTIGTYVSQARAKLKLMLEDYWTEKDARK